MAVRLFGVETEYAIAALGRDAAPPADRTPLLRGFMEAAREQLVHLPHHGGGGLFTANGGRLYVDGQHPEFGTPECAHPSDAVRYVRAGDRIVAAAAQAVAVRQPELGEVVVLRSNVDYLPESCSTWGSHESYLHQADPDRLPRQLVPHLASRIVYTGAGGFLPPQADAAAFTLSPRVWHLESVISAASTGGRGIFHIKDETLAAGGHHRLHVICGETLCCDEGLWLRLGATALVVALIDAGVEPGEAVQLRQPLAAMQTFAGDPTCRATAALENGGELGAIAIQRHYLDLAQRHLAHPAMPEWAGEACARWSGMLDRLAGAPATVSAALDWAAKWALFRRHARRSGLAWGECDSGGRPAHGVQRPGPVQLPLHLQRPTTRARAALAADQARYRDDAVAAGQRWRAYLRLQRELYEIDLRFGQLGEKSLCAALQRAGVLDAPMFDDAAVRDAVNQPPAGGRAAVRGQAVRQLHRGGVAGACDRVAVWDHARSRFIDLSDPLDATAKWMPARRWAGHRRRWAVPTGILGQAIALYHEGRHAAALGLLWQMLHGEVPVEAPGELASARFWAATILHNTGRLAEAGAVLDELVDAGADDDVLYKALSRAALVAAEIPRPLEEIERAIATAERFVAGSGHTDWQSRILLARARLLEARGHYGDALDVAEDALRWQTREHNGLAPETYARAVLILCLSARRLDQLLTYLRDWEHAADSGNAAVRVLVFCGHSECSRAGGDAEEALRWARRAAIRRDVLGNHAVRALVGESLVRAHLCRGDFAAARGALRLHLRGSAQCGEVRFRRRLLWLDCQLAAAQHARGGPIIDPIYGHRFAPAPAAGASICPTRLARARRAALREARSLDALLECDARQRELAARQELLTALDSATGVGAVR
ncbi:MAG: proteasome accessory factor PafA2 family protein [Candidatus Binatia bacterium]